VWVIYAAADPFPPLGDVRQLRVAIVPDAIPADLTGIDRWVAVWNANMYTAVGGSVTSEFNGCQYRHPNHLIFGHPWEAESRRKWLRVGPGDVFLDVGSAIGSWSLPAAACGATAFAFDPGTDAVTLRRLAAENGLSGRLTVRGEFVSDVSGRAVPRADVPWSSVEPEAELGDAVTVSVDDFVGREGLGRVDLIKVDIDGGEREAIVGMTETLRRFRPPVVIETHTFLGVPTAEVVGLLEDRGYRATAHPMEEGYYFHVHGIPRA
jgi:FkbM family methyltransferase